MCRGANLGVCCAQGCDERISCQDTGGYCDAHDPFDYSWDAEADEIESHPIPVDDPEKRRVYTLSRLAVGIKNTEASVRADQLRLAQMHTRVRELTGT